MTMQHIRDAYKVPAKRGGRVIYQGNGKDGKGIITGSRDGRLLIRLDGDKHSCAFHPTWKIKYLTD